MQDQANSNHTLTVSRMHEYEDKDVEMSEKDTDATVLYVKIRT